MQSLFMNEQNFKSTFIKQKLIQIITGKKFNVKS